MTEVDLIIHNAGQFVTCASGGKPKRGAAMQDVGIIADGADAIAGAKFVCVGTSSEIFGAFTADETVDAQTRKPGTPKVKLAFDAELAKKVGADPYGMKQYVLVILKSGPKQMELGKERDAIFRGHMANIIRRADQGKLAVAGPFGKNDKDFRGLFILNVKTVEEAKALVDTDPTVKAGILMGEFVRWYGSAALMETNNIHKKITERNFKISYEKYVQNLNIYTNNIIVRDTHVWAAANRRIDGRCSRHEWSGHSRGNRYCDQ